MKPIYIISFLLLACASEVKRPVPDTDSLTNVEVLAIADSIKSLLFFNGVDSTIQSETDATIAYINQLQSKVMAGQVTQIELMGVKKQLKELRSDKSGLFGKIEQLKKDKEELEKDKVIIISELKTAASKIKTERESTSKALVERNKLQAKIDNAGRLTVASVKVTAYGFTKPLFGTPQRFETLLAKKVKQVEVSFVIPQNKLFTPKEYTLIAIIHGTAGIPEAKGIREVMVVTYNGTEQDVSIGFNKAIDWRASEHIVELFNEKELLYTGHLTLK